MRTPLLAAAALLLAASPALADTLVYNVNGIQVGADGKLQRFGGLVIGDDGKVERLIQRTEELDRPVEHEIDGRGLTLLPGLIDAHGHVIDSPGGGGGLGLVLIQLDLTGANSIADLQQRLKRYADANPGDGWITGRGWNQEYWSGKRFPTAADLDIVVRDRPVWLTRVDGHAAVGNTAALRAAGVTAATPVPAGGRFERDANGQPSGLFIDNAIALVADKIPATTAEMMDRALAAAQEALLGHGLTAVADMGTSVKGWEAMRRMGETGRLQIRIMSYSDGLAPFGAVAGNAPTAWLYGDRLRMGGVKLYADGALGSRGALLKQPYADKPDSRGLRFLSDSELLAQAQQAASGGAQVAIHAIGDAANDQVIGIFEKLGASQPGDRRWRIEHVQVVDPADMPRLKRAGIIASMQPTHQTSDDNMARARLGEARLAGAYAWQSIARLGVPLAFGSDFPVESPNPFHGLSAAVSRSDPTGQPPGGWRPHERVSFEQALHGFTRGAAYASFAEGRIGSLDPGRHADFILVDRDVSRVTPVDLAATQVLETWVSGKKVWQRSSSGGPGERGR